MPFTGKATYSAGVDLPEIAEDVSDLVSVLAGTETPLLDLLGDSARQARSTVHEWLDETLALVTAEVSSNDNTGEILTIASNIDRLNVGDICRFDPAGEIVRIVSLNVADSTALVQRNVGGLFGGITVLPATLVLVSSPVLEGAQASATRSTARVRVQNFTQIFASSVEVSGSQLAVRSLGVRDELDHQKSQRLRELLRSLESSVINGVAPTSTPVGSATVPRSMRGLLSYVATNRFDAADDTVIPSGPLTETKLNLALRRLWESGSTQVDTIVVGGREKRTINSFIASERRFAGTTETFKDMVSVYESDFGVCRVVLSRHMPVGSVLLLDSSRVEVLPLAGRSFHFKRHASTGDSEMGQVIGEYTLEVRNEAAHGFVSGFTA